MARMTTDERRINFICGELGFKPDMVHEFTKMMLIEYKRRKDLMGLSIKEMTVEEAHLNKQELRREFLEILRKPFEEALECYKDFVLKVVYATWFDEKIAQILDQVEDFRSVGGIYKDILETCYFSDTPLTNDEATRSVGIGDSALDYRKREAIKLFGISIFSLCQRRENEDIVAGIVKK